MKAKRFLTEGLNIIKRKLILEPTFAEAVHWLNWILENARSISLLSVDVETFAGTITCVGFAWSKEDAITIPFYDPTAPDKNYWKEAWQEKVIKKLVKRVMESSIPKLGQNFLYDTQYFVAEGITPQRVLHDTMIRHHSLYPELEKGLGFMASVYTDEAPWKVLRDRNKDNFKLDDE